MAKTEEMSVRGKLTHVDKTQTAGERLDVVAVGN